MFLRISKRLKDIEERLDQLECNHDDVDFKLSHSIFDGGKYCWHYLKICKQCGKGIGTITEKEKLEGEVADIQKNLVKKMDRLRILEG